MTATITTEPDAPSVSLDERVAAACGQLNACYANLVEVLGEVIAAGAWRGHGIRSVEQWIGWRTGLSASHCRTLAALVAAAESHPQVVEGFRAGELSIDQAGLAVQARPEHEGDIAVCAKVMTLPQLRLAVRASNVSAAEREAVAAKDADAKAADVAEPSDAAESGTEPASALSSPTPRAAPWSSPSTPARKSQTFRSARRLMVVAQERRRPARTAYQTLRE